MPIVLNGTTGDISGSSLTGIDTGKILQAVQTIKTDSFSSTATSMTDVTGLSVNITPSSTNSKILVTASIDAYVQKTSSYNASSYFIVVRDTTALSGVHMRTRVDNSMTCNYINAGGNAVLIYLDSPNTTSQVTYKIQFTNWGGSHTTTVNGQANNTYYAKSTIVAQEVAA